MNLQDQRVLVTGATTGIGRETATLFARRGATVVITGRDPNEQRRPSRRSRPRVDAPSSSAPT
jgi:3-oxoacyl-[acyl-carrier protein] reductase